METESPALQWLVRVKSNVVHGNNQWLLKHYMDTWCFTGWVELWSVFSGWRPGEEVDGKGTLPNHHSFCLWKAYSDQTLCYVLYVHFLDITPNRAGVSRWGTREWGSPMTSSQSLWITRLGLKPQLAWSWVQAANHHSLLPGVLCTTMAHPHIATGNIQWLQDSGFTRKQIIKTRISPDEQKQYQRSHQGGKNMETNELCLTLNGKSPGRSVTLWLAVWPKQSPTPLKLCFPTNLKEAQISRASRLVPQSHVSVTVLRAFL